MYFINRNGQDFGPYDIQVLATYVRTGQILKCDEAREQSTGEVNSVGYFLRKNKIKVRVQNKGNVFSQFKDIGSELIFPKKTIASRTWTKDRTLLIRSLWIFYAQGANRCHDLDNSGWYQLIPFYSLWLIFKKGNSGPNSYGDDPKV